MPPGQPQSYSQPTQPSQPPRSVQSQPPAAPKTTTSKPRKSNLLSLLNDEPEEPKATPPRPVSRASSRSDVRSEVGAYGGDVSASALPPGQYGRNIYAPPQPLPQASMPQGPPVVDLTNDNAPPVPRSHSRSDSWQVRQPQPFNMPVSQGQQQSVPASLVNSPHAGQLNQPPPPFADARMGDARRMDFPMNHRAVLAQHNMPRANPSPPPRGAPFTNSPHLTPHSRTSSVSVPSAQLRQTPQPPGGPNATTQILQPNPYTEVDPPGSTQRPPVNVGLRESVSVRGSPHPGAGLRGAELQAHPHALSHNEQGSTHNANLAFPGSAAAARGEGNVSGGMHSGSLSAGPGGPMRPSSVLDSYGRQYREISEHGPAQLQHPQTHDRDTGRELGMRIEALREAHALDAAQREPYALAAGSREAAQREQLLNEERIRSVSTGRSYTPLSQQRSGPGSEPSGFPPRYRNEMPVHQGLPQGDNERERFGDPRMGLSMDQQQRHIREERLEQQRAMREQEHAARGSVSLLRGESPHPQQRAMMEREVEREMDYRLGRPVTELPRSYSPDRGSRPQQRPRLGDMAERESQRELEHRLSMHHRAQSHALERERVERGMEMMEREREMRERDMMERERERDRERARERDSRMREESLYRDPRVSVAGPSIGPGPGQPGHPQQSQEWASVRQAQQHPHPHPQQSRDREREREINAQFQQAHAQARAQADAQGRAQAEAHAHAQRERYQSLDRSQGMDRERGGDRDREGWQQQQMSRHGAHQGQAQPRQ